MNKSYPFQEGIHVIGRDAESDGSGFQAHLRNFRRPDKFGNALANNNGGSANESN